MNHTHVVGKETNTKQEQKCKKPYAASNNAQTEHCFRKTINNNYI